VKFKIAADPEDLLSADEYEELVAQDAH